ncbi:MAG: hypothetical protein VX463_11935, partial [Pseudomonadota bacterium]|nr:hypothetical protein [Pseudomonadota bacterium]
HADANEFEPALKALAHDGLAAIAADPALVAAVKAQNAAGAPDQATIDQLDKDWRAQVGSGSAPLVDKVAANPGSKVLADARDASEGLITEAFAMDQVGLNVAVSDPTSDYWQGDEDKWRMTYKAGAGAIHISDVELDESTQTYQAQVSLPVVDPDGGAPIGAVTFGINVELLN